MGGYFFYTNELTPNQICNCRCLNLKIIIQNLQQIDQKIFEKVFPKKE